MLPEQETTARDEILVLEKNEIGELVSKHISIPIVGSAVNAVRTQQRVYRNIHVMQALAESTDPYRNKYPLITACCNVHQQPPPVIKISKPVQTKQTIAPTPPLTEKVPKSTGSRSRTHAPVREIQSLYDLQKVLPDGSMSPRPPSRRIGCGMEISGAAVDDESMRLLFNAYDTNGSGTIDREEFKRRYKNFESFGMVKSDKEIDRLFSKYDTNRDGSLGFEEFAMLMLFRFKM
jgi:hypothetical protein